MDLRTRHRAQKKFFLKKKKKKKKIGKDVGISLTLIFWHIHLYPIQDTRCGTLARTVLDPFAASVKDIENLHKSDVEEGVRLTAKLQEQYKHLKKAKQVLEELQNAHSEANNASVRAQCNPQSKEKELDKAGVPFCSVLLLWKSSNDLPH
jgi:hypothetical protein